MKIIIYWRRALRKQIYVPKLLNSVYKTDIC